MVAPQVALHPGCQDRPEREAEEVGTQRLEIREGAGERVLQSLRLVRVMRHSCRRSSLWVLLMRQFEIGVSLPTAYIS